MYVRKVLLGFCVPLEVLTVFFVTMVLQDLENAEEQLGMVMGKLAKLLQTKNTCHLGTILCLTATAIVLFLLVLYT